MDSRPTIAIDIDDVIAENAKGFIEFSNQRYGTDFTVDHYQEHWGEVWKVEHTEVLKRADEFHESGHVRTYTPIVGAKEALCELQKSHRLIALTSRRIIISDITREWLDIHYTDIFSEIRFCGFFDQSPTSGIHMTKATLVQEMGAVCLIDDQLKHVLAVADAGGKALLFGEYAWNKIETLPENVERVKNWNEVLEYFTHQKI